jgi:hypothetical protein
MARLYYRHPVTRDMMPLSLGSTGGGGPDVNEVTVASAQPTDGSELWMDLTNAKLKYRNPSTGLYVDVPFVVDTGPEMTDGNIKAGAGLTGGGLQSTSPTLNVGGSTSINVAADSISVNTSYLSGLYAPVNGQAAVTITDWNQAVLNNTTYMGNSAANAPDTGWYYGQCISYGTPYKQQIIYPFANARNYSGTCYIRELEASVWGDWNRTTSYIHGRDAADSGIWIQQNGYRNNMGIRRFFMGMWKDKTSNNASALDEWRVQCYNTAGVYTWTAIKVPQSGVVSFPKGSAMLRAALTEETPIAADTAATVGNVVDIVTALMAKAGLHVEPAEVIQLMEGTDE